MKRFLVTLTVCVTILSVLFLTAIPLFAGEGNTASAMKTLSGLRALNGTWHFGDTVSSQGFGRGDIFALSDVVATAFVLEADVEFVNHSGAASLLFFASDTPAKGSYVANIDLSAGNARIFRFESGGSATTKGEFALTGAMRAQSRFHLRVEVKDGHMLYYIDDTLAVSVKDDYRKPGTKLGLLTYNTNVNYTNLKYGLLDEASPSLTQLTTPTGDVSTSLLMNYKVPHGTTSLPLVWEVNGEATVSASDGVSVAVNGKNITVGDITDSFTLTFAIQKGDITVNHILRVTMETDPDSVYNEQWRSQFHFSPFVNWLNDPNGLVYDPSNKTYHLFFQYNPFGLNIANQVWAHAISTDLVHWEELGIAIDQDHLGAVFSGSAVVDENNTTGFFNNNKEWESKLVALFTCDGGDTTYGVEKQCIAYSKDHGVTWIRPTYETHGFENPIITNEDNMYGRDFRDPKIFWYDNKWFMVVAGGRARLFVSDDLIDWTLACDMGFDSECPDLYPLAVDGEKNHVKWVYTASGKWYVVGRLEKISDTSYEFVAEGDRITYNGGSEVYATQSFFNDGSGNNRRIAISWIQDSSAQSLSGKTWNGAMTLPYVQSLRTVNGRILLTSYPVQEVNALRNEKVIDLSSPSVEEAAQALKTYPGVAYDAVIRFKPSDDTILSMELRSNRLYKTMLVYDSVAAKVSVTRVRAGSATGAIPTGTMEMPLYPDADGYVTLRILMDKTVVEVFGNEGEAALCGMIFPDADCINTYLSVSGEIEIEALSMWRMGSIWHDNETVLPDAGLYFETSASAVSLNESITVSAYLLDEEGRRTDPAVTFSGMDEDLIDNLQVNPSSISFEGVEKGTMTITATVGSLSKTMTLSVVDLHFHTNLEGWRSQGDWYETEKGYGLSGSNGDSFAFSNGKNEGEFVYEGVADFGTSGGCLGLVFGVSRPNQPSSGIWYGANVDTHGSQAVMKLFCNRMGQEIWAETYTFDSQSDQWELRVEYTDGVLFYSVNGMEVTREVANLTSGALGLVSWNGGGAMDNVIYTAKNGGQGDSDTADTTDEPASSSSAETTLTPDSEEVPSSTDESESSTPDSDTPDTDLSGGNDSRDSDDEKSLLPILLASLGAICIGSVGFLIWKKRRKGKR